MTSKPMHGGEAKKGRRIGRLFHRLRRDERGVAAIEFAFIAGTLAVAILNTVDVGMYAFKKMEVENASQMGGQAAWKTCDLQHLPATTQCSGLTSAVTTAVHATSLGSSVGLSGPTEGYYCVNSSGALVYASDVSTKPANCSAYGGTSSPGDYVVVQATYAYAPLFPGITVAHFFSSTISKTTYMRVG
jgi:Flp pilus assembly protein TadG